MSSTGKWFKDAMAKDFSFRQSQNKPLFYSGTNRSPHGTIPAGIDEKTKQGMPVEPKPFVAGQSEAGGEDIAG